MQSVYQFVPYLSAVLSWVNGKWFRMVSDPNFIVLRGCPWVKHERTIIEYHYLSICPKRDDSPEITEKISANGMREY